MALRCFRQSLPLQSRSLFFMPSSHGLRGGMRYVRAPQECVMDELNLEATHNLLNELSNTSWPVLSGIPTTR